MKTIREIGMFLKKRSKLTSGEGFFGVLDLKKQGIVPRIALFGSLVALVMGSTGCERNRLYALSGGTPSSSGGTIGQTRTIVWAWQSNANSPCEGTPAYSITGDVEIYVGISHAIYPTKENPTCEGTMQTYFGDMMSIRRGIRTRHVIVAVGGTDSNQWRNQYWPRISEAVRIFNADAVIPIGGESDYFNGLSSSDAYYAWKDIIGKVEKDVGRKVTWYMPLNSCIYGDGRVREAQQALINDGFCRPGPDIDSIKRADKRDEWMGPKWLHFKGQGLIEHAKLWYDVLSRDF